MNNNIPKRLYEDDAVCFIASRYHVSTQEAVRCFLRQDDTGSERDAFRLEDNEVEILRGLMEAYRSMEDEGHK